jgi:dipeptidase E
LRLLLGSGGLRSEARRAVYFEEMGNHFKGCEEVIFIPYAGAEHADYTSKIVDFSRPSGVNLRGIESFEDPYQAIAHAQGIYVGGGNTFLLTKSLHENNLIEIVRKRVLQGMPYMGVSAGANVACPTMQTTNDMPIVFPSSFETFDLVPFQINAHYHDGNIWLKEGETFVQHFGETRAQRIQEFHEHNRRPVLGLWEGAFLRWNNDSGVIVGGDATVFHPQSKPVTYGEGTVLDSNLIKRLC